MKEKENKENKEKSNCVKNDDISLKIGLQFLYVSMGKDVYDEIMGLMPYIQGDVATAIAVTSLIVKYLETTDTITLPNRVEFIVLQNGLWRNNRFPNRRFVTGVSGKKYSSVKFRHPVL